jgi:predicted HAD superfamily Cof-like phosphohydrolase
VSRETLEQISNLTDRLSKVADDLGGIIEQKASVEEGLHRQLKILNENLTSVQKRCTELLVEKRYLEQLLHDEGVKRLRDLRLDVQGKLRSQVTDFHLAVGQPVLDKPQVPSDERVRLRARLITEEFFETMRALFQDEERNDPYSWINVSEDNMRSAIERSRIVARLPELVDGLADLDYVVEGTRLEFGINGIPIAAEVHRANMAKAVGTKREDGKILKPDGWKPPDIEGELRRQGWEGRQGDGR